MIKLPEGDHPLTIALCDHQRGEGHRGWWPCSVGASDVEVLADHILEEHPATARTIKDLGQAELGLQDGDVVAAASAPIGRRKRMRQPAQPFAQQAIDLGSAQAIAELLQRLDESWPAT